MSFDIAEGGRSRDITMNMIRILSNYKKGFRVVHINAQSLNNKLDEFKLIFENTRIDIICVSETWLIPSTADNTVCPNGYKVFRSDRESLGGGVAIFVRNGISCRACGHANRSYDRDVEMIFIEVLSIGKRMLVGCIYRPSRRSPFTSLYSTLETLAPVYDDIVITGDFNANILLDTDLTDNMLSLGLFPVNRTNPTHHTSSSSTLIDIYFVSNIDRVILYDQISAPCFSRHDLIFLIYHFLIEEVDQRVSSCLLLHKVKCNWS